MSLALPLALALAAPLPVAAPAAGPTPIYGGGPVEPGAWPEVVAVMIPGGICTGTLVSDRVVLTAAHCLDDSHSAAALQVRRGDDVTSPGTPVVAVERFGVHPQFCDDLETCKVDTWDYGYLVLAEPIVGVTPARPLVTQAEWDEAMQPGGLVTLVGFGYSETGPTHIKRQVDVPITRFSPSGLEFQAGGMGLDSCTGDSGGPAFATLASGEVVIAGVTSRGNLTCGKGGIYAIPYAALCWLDAETGTALGDPACDACDCLVTAPAREDRCGCAASDPATPLLALLLVLARPRRPRPRARP